jgi:hypothetical protein
MDRLLSLPKLQLSSPYSFLSELRINIYLLEVSDRLENQQKKKDQFLGLINVLPYPGTLCFRCELGVFPLPAVLNCRVTKPQKHRSTGKLMIAELFLPPNTLELGPVLHTQVPCQAFREFGHSKHRSSIKTPSIQLLDSGEERPYHTLTLQGCWKCRTLTRDGGTLQRCGSCKRVCYRSNGG